MVRVLVRLGQANVKKAFVNLELPLEKTVTMPARNNFTAQYFTAPPSDVADEGSDYAQVGRLPRRRQAALHKNCCDGDFFRATLGGRI
ncbi:MAG: hypothetical protein EOP09_01810 [Proteobacteria bacterium]|nr:MAG: hypothetical protein EOP09_01810 [Pseudomonadota bacterium]